MEIKNDRGQCLLAYYTREMVCLHRMQTAVLCGSLATNGTIPFVIYLARLKNGSRQRSFFCLLNEGKDTIWKLDVNFPILAAQKEVAALPKSLLLYSNPIIDIGFHELSVSRISVLSVGFHILSVEFTNIKQIN
jgi:hypothetical protein